ncbi:AraC family transcriptional regulator [Pseudonocardia sp. GCM10023141]|uniref:AraC family transcriptional regulator n=1 Tax=Pseudonocardia sp. GCM10023141 TaxID=3252653 RepID=UPI003618675B
MSVHELPSSEQIRPVSVLDVHDGEADHTMWICRFDADEPGGWGVHHHRQHQVVWVSEGLTTAVVGDRSWVLPPTRALFIPAWMPHDTHNRLPSLLHCLYVWPQACPLDWTTPTVFAIDGLLRELMLAMAGAGLHATVEEPAQALFFGLAERHPDPGVALPVPADHRARVVADHLLSTPSDPRSLEEWSLHLRASASTLRRAFVTGTGMTFTDWRTQVRLQASLPLLANRVPVAAVARRVGYESATGYVEAFRRHFGHTPAAHFRTHRVR